MKAKCPYCEHEMKKGFVEGDGRQPLIWVEENQEKTFIQRINDDDYIVLVESFFHKTSVASNYCDICKKIIIEIK